MAAVAGVEEGAAAGAVVAVPVQAEVIPALAVSVEAAILTVAEPAGAGSSVYPAVSSNW
ncbi:hypothetical protein ACFPT7_11830 [Acidicapsa dinghuensis]|uniref:Uncharacterized protein n=1 Tax=Acidicapsa dinghuensis TaxID=2218256 RepID=A0ABW1EFS8_9BACT